VKQGRETLPFELAIRTEAERCRATLPLQHRRWSYVDRGRYSVQLARIAQHFPTTQIFALKSEDLQDDPHAALARIAQFLGVGPFPRTARREVFALPYDAPMPPSARKYLCETLATDVHALERMLGWDCSDWLRDQ